jgi:hypothetical protein
MIRPRRSRGGGARGGAVLALVFLIGLGGCEGCARTGRLSFTEPITPEPTEGGADSAKVVREQLYAALFGDTAIGFQPGSADTSRRYLGRLRNGYTADTLNVLLMGDNRPAYRVSRLKPQLRRIRGIFSWNPINWVRGLANIPILLVRGTVPDLALWRDLPDLVRGTPSEGREEPVFRALVGHVHTLTTRGQTVAAVINAGDLVKDGRYPAQWERFLALVRPLAKDVPYFPIAGNHERTDSPEGLHNWHTATGLPITGDRLYYTFDSADGWVRFVALDSNPMTDPQNRWTREAEVRNSAEQLEWLEAALKGHVGPAIVFLHHPPFSLGYHRIEWESDPMLRERRARLVRILREAGLSVLVAGHEHAYERALLTCGDAVMIVLVSGGAGSPLHAIPTGPRAASLFAAYEVEGCAFRPEDVFASMSFTFTHLKIWFGGGEFLTYAVDEKGRTAVIDQVKIDLKRFGIPEIDQFKIPIPQEKPTLPPEDKKKEDTAATPDSTGASERLLTTPPPAKPKATPKPGASSRLRASPGRGAR